MDTYFSYFFITAASLVTAYLLVKYLRSKTLYYKSLIKYKPITPQNTVISFDLHDVIVRYDYKQIARHILNTEKKLPLFIHVLNPFFWWDCIKLFANNCVAEQYLFIIGNKYKYLKPYIPLGIKIANSQKLNPRMFDLIKTLKRKGYELHLFSNIGETIFQDLRQKVPDLFDQFDCFTIPSQQNGYLRKPDQDAFDNFILKHKDVKKQIIFIDDKTKNIKKGLDNGIIAIHFSCPCQIKKELQEIGVL